MKIRKICKTLSVLLLLTALAVTQIPVSDVLAQTISDFQIEGKNLIKYAGVSDQDISIPAGVKSIAENSFSGHHELIRVTIDDEVEKIGNTAFADCNSLRTVVIGDSVTEIESGAFSNCPNLQSVTLGAGVARLGNGVFAGCPNLREIKIDSGNTHLSYRNGVIYGDDQKILYQLLPGYPGESLEVPATVKEIAGYAFWGNPYLKKVVLGSNLTEIPAYSFSNCMNLTSVTVPYSVRGIGARAFENCVNLTNINIPESITNIHQTAFDGCPRVKLGTVAGTYGADYDAGRDVSQAALTEQAEVDAAITVAPGETAAGTGAGVTAADPTGAADSAAISSGGTDSAAVNSGGAGSAAAETTDPAVPIPETAAEMVTPEVLLGKSTIVSGRALVFIDNKESKVYSGYGIQGAPAGGTFEDGLEPAGGGLTGGGAEETGAIEAAEAIQSTEADGAINNAVLDNLADDSGEKGFGFPKYTIVDDRIIANQAYYLNTELTSFDMPQGIKEIGDFAFARSGLTSITIPEGVERIGYGAFYHCDNLREAVIPSSVTEIEPAAFEHTAWLKNWQNNVGQDYLIAGDGILIAYSGRDSVVNIPDEVRQIAAGVFKDHTGITAVNLPKGLEIIGEEAFAGCRNLTTVNGGEALLEIRDRAFQDCALKKVYIPETVTGIGLRAFDLAEAGTDAVTFAGRSLPAVIMEKSAGRLANEDYRGLAFGNMNKAFIGGADIDMAETVLDETLLGFRGEICLPDGTVVRKSSPNMPLTAGAPGVAVRINSRSLLESGIADAAIPGGRDSYVLKITDSDQAAAQIKKAYGSLYGNQEPEGLLAYDINLYEQSTNTSISRLGKQYMTLTLPMPEDISAGNLHVVCVDDNGQLEELAHQVVLKDNQECIQFTASHFSAYGIYQYQDGAALQTGSGDMISGPSAGKRDVSPDTGDLIHPKWLLAFGLLCASAALFFFQGRRGADDHSFGV